MQYGMQLPATALVICAIAAALQVLTLLKLLTVLVQRLRKRRSWLAPCCRGLMVEVERWLGKVSGTKKEIKAYRDLQRAILQRACTCFIGLSLFYLLRVQIDLAQGIDVAYPALDIPVLVGYAVSLSVLVMPCEVSPMVLDTLHALAQLLCAMALYFSKTEDLPTVAYLTVTPRLVSALWVQYGWKALVGHCLCSGVLWWRDSRMVSIALGTLALLMILTWTLHGSISVAAKQRLSFKTKRVAMESATALMNGICDCVVELDSTLKLLEDSPQIGTMLFCVNSAATMAGSDFLDLVPFLI